MKPVYVHILFILAVLVFPAALPSYAQTGELAGDSTSEAQEFFKNCVARPIVSTYEETDKAFCACAATNVYNWLERPLASTPDPLGVVHKKELDANALISHVYGPCLYLPIYDMTYNECYNSKEYEYFVSRDDLRDGMCQCLAKGDSDYFKKFAGPYLEMKISEGDKIVDPIHEIKKDVNYYDMRFNLETDCYEEYQNYQ